MQLQLAPGERQASRLGGGPIGPKENSVDPIEQENELVFVRRIDDEHSAPLVWRKPSVVEVIAVQSDEGATELLRQPEVPHVGGAPQTVFLQHEEHVPAQAVSHVGHEAGGHVGVSVDPRLRRQTLGVGRKLGGKGAQLSFYLLSFEF